MTPTASNAVASRCLIDQTSMPTYRRSSQEYTLPVFAEFARVLTRGGRLIVHTPNAWSHFVAGAKCVPKRFKTRLAQRLDGRAANDIFPALYRANTTRRIRALMTKVGLREESLRMLASDATFATAHPALALAELALIRLTLMDMFRGFRVSILASYAKP